MSDKIEQVIFNVSEALLVPVLVLALLALAAVVVEVGAFLVELQLRRRRRFQKLASAALAARRDIDEGERERGQLAVRDVAWSRSMSVTLNFMVGQAGMPGGEAKIAKSLADFDFDCQKKLGRTRLLVRAGPALGLMGTLIPLSPALDALARGDVDKLSENLRIAFSVTVLGILIGAVAYGLSLFRDRIYGQDLSDLEYVGAVLTDPDSAAPTEEKIEPTYDESHPAPGTVP